jgi:hypothetical protein
MEWYEILLLVFGSILFIIVILVIVTKAKKDPLKDDFEINNIDIEKEKELVGKQGEETVNSLLEELNEKYGSKYISNFIIKYKNKSSFEVDHIFISRGGIYIIETKSLKGIITYSSLDNKFYRENDYKYDSFRNPLKQNEYHIKKIKELFIDDIELKGIVVFTRADISQLNNFNNIFDLNTLEKYLIDQMSLDIYDDDSIEDIYDSFIELQLKWGISKEEHINNIKNNPY